MFSHLSGLNFALDASYVFELKYSGRRPVCWSFFVTGCLLGEKGEGVVFSTFLGILSVLFVFCQVASLKNRGKHIS